MFAQVRKVFGDDVKEYLDIGHKGTNVAGQVKKMQASINVRFNP